MSGYIYVHTSAATERLKGFGDDDDCRVENKLILEKKSNLIFFRNLCGLIETDGATDGATMMGRSTTRGACEATSTTSRDRGADARKHAGDGYVEALAEENATLRRLLAARERELEEVRAILASRSVEFARRLGIDVDVDVDDDDGYASGSWSPTLSSSANVCFSRSAKSMGRQRAATTTRDVLTTPPVATTTTTPVMSNTKTTNGAVFALESAFDKVRISPTNPFDGFANDEEDEASPSARRRSDAETETETETENLSPKSRALSGDFARCDAHQEKTPDAKDGVSLRPSTPGAPLRHQNHQNAAASADARARAVRPDPVDVKSIAPRRLFDAVA